MSGAISRGRETWRLLGRAKQNGALDVSPSLGAPCPYGAATADLTGQAPALDKNIFTSCLPRPLARAGEQLPELSH